MDISAFSKCIQKIQTCSTDYLTILYLIQNPNTSLTQEPPVSSSEASHLEFSPWFHKQIQDHDVQKGHGHPKNQEKSKKLEDLILLNAQRAQEAFKTISELLKKLDIDINSLEKTEPDESKDEPKSKKSEHNEGNEEEENKDEKDGKKPQQDILLLIGIYCPTLLIK